MNKLVFKKKLTIFIQNTKTSLKVFTVNLFFCLKNINLIKQFSHSHLCTKRYVLVENLLCKPLVHWTSVIDYHVNLTTQWADTITVSFSVIEHLHFCRMAALLTFALGF